jgi:hypothetical protein
VWRRRREYPSTCPMLPMLLTRSPPSPEKKSCWNIPMASLATFSGSARSTHP